jgi:O-antigen ligase
MQSPTTVAPTPQLADRRRYKPDTLMYLTAAFLWVSVWRVQDLVPIIGKLKIPMAIEGLLAIAILGSMNGPRSLKWTKSRIFSMPFILLGIMLVGLPFSLWIGKSIIFLTKDFGPTLLLMSGIALSIRESEDINWFAFANLIGATVYATWIFLFFHIGADGRLGSLAYYDSNDFGLLLDCTIPFAVYFLRPTVSTFKRIFALCSLGLLVLMLIKSGSRGGFIAFIVVMGYVVWVFRAIPTRLRVGAVTVGLVIMVAFGSTTYWGMMTSMLHPHEDYNMTSQIGRKSIWKRGIGYMLTHPVLGVGVATFEQAEGTLSDISREYSSQGRGLKWSTAHNSFVLVGAELGVGALILFVSMIGTALYHLSQIKGGPGGDPVITPDDTAFAQTLIAALLGFCVAGFFVSAAYFSFLYVLLGLVIAIDSLSRRRHARVIAPVAGQPAVPVSVRSPKRQVPRTHWLPAR